MVNPRVSEIGKTYGRLRVLALAPVLDFSIKYPKAHWICVCHCGVFKVVDGAKLRSGHTQSCGCLRADNKYVVHGHAVGAKTKASPTYVSWASMHTRCSNENSISYKNYGGKGISICPEWKSFEAFFADMGERPSGSSLERIDSGRDYCKENCVWASRTQQARNRSSVVSVFYEGESKSLSEWCERLNLNYRRMYYLVRTKGIEFSAAITRSKDIS